MYKIGDKVRVKLDHNTPEFEAKVVGTVQYHGEYGVRNLWLVEPKLLCDGGKWKMFSLVGPNQENYGVALPAIEEEFMDKID